MSCNYKYIHFMSMNSPIFNGEMMNFVNLELFGEQEHLFIVKHVEIYNKYSKIFSNVRLNESMGYKDINKCSEYQKIILHSLFLYDYQILFLKKNIVRKIIWCVWGHDLYRGLPKGSRIQRIYSNTIGPIAKRLATRTIKRFNAIAAGYVGDVPIIRKKYGDKIAVSNAAYSAGYYLEDIKVFTSKKKITTDKSKLNVMIGHSGFDFLQHKKYLDLLLKYKDDNILINIPLSYGVNSYIQEVIEYAQSLYHEDQLNIITENMPKDKYVEFIDGIDVAIFDYVHQSAFGNLSLLALLNKKIYLNPLGVMYSGFVDNNLIIYDCNDIGRVSIEELKKVDYFNVIQKDSFVVHLYDKNWQIAEWKCLFN